MLHERDYQINYNQCGTFRVAGASIHVYRETQTTFQAIRSVAFAKQLKSEHNPKPLAQKHKTNVNQMT